MAHSLGAEEAAEGAEGGRPGRATGMWVPETGRFQSRGDTPASPAVSILLLPQISVCDPHPGVPTAVSWMTLCKEATPGKAGQLPAKPAPTPGRLPPSVPGQGVCSLEGSVETRSDLTWGLMSSVSLTLRHPSPQQLCLWGNRAQGACLGSPSPEVAPAVIPQWWPQGARQQASGGPPGHIWGSDIPGGDCRGPALVAPPHGVVHPGHTFQRRTLFLSL